MENYKFTKGEWHISKNGDVSGDEHPICSVEYGEWGDQFPTLKLEGLSLDRKCVAVNELIVYGEIPREESEANSKLISAAPNLLYACENSLKQLELQMMGDSGTANILRKAINKALNGLV